MIDKLVIRGADALTDCELLSLILGGDDDSLELSQRVLSKYNDSIGDVATEQLSNLRMVEGLGAKRAAQLVAASEWGRRCSLEQGRLEQAITSSQDVVNIYRSRIKTLDYETCWVLYLNSSNRIVEEFKVSQGGITSTTVDARLIVKRALELLSTQMIIVHNHPSGDATPSPEDVELTKQIMNAAALFDIQLLDHIIITANGECSLSGAGLM